MRKKRKQKRPRPVEYESFEAPGLTMERLGRFISFKTHRTTEEQKALNEHLQQLYRSLPTTITEKARRLEQLAREWRPDPIGISRASHGEKLEAKPLEVNSTPGHRHVWSVSLYDLMVISELAEPFPLLLHYIVRRVQAIKQGLVQAHDELDLFGAYLDSGLYFDPNDFRQLDSLTVGTHTDVFDAYYMYKEGIRRKSAKKPVVRMSPEFRAFVEALGHSGIPRRLDVLLHLLDMDGDSRQTWIRGVVEAKRRFRRDGRLHTFTQAREGEGAFGLVYLCGPELDDREELMKRYCRDKMDQMGAAGWLAVEDTQRTPGYAFRRIVAVGNISML